MECLSRPGKEHNTEDRMCNNTYAVSDTTIETNIKVLKVHFELGSTCVFFLMEIIRKMYDIKFLFQMQLDYCFNISILF